MTPYRLQCLIVAGTLFALAGITAFFLIQYLRTGQ